MAMDLFQVGLLAKYTSSQGVTSTSYIEGVRKNRSGTYYFFRETGWLLQSHVTAVATDKKIMYMKRRKEGGLLATRPIRGKAVLGGMSSPFKLGDIVKIISNSNSHDLEIGDIVRIRRNDYYGINNNGSAWKLSASSNTFRDVDLELVGISEKRTLSDYPY